MQTLNVQPVTLIMPHGGDDTAATALARACNVTMQGFDLATLAAALTQGRRCVVVWSDPRQTVADALRHQSSASAAAEAWRKSTEDLLRLFARHRRSLLLVAADFIERGTPDAVAQLGDRLPLVAPVSLQHDDKGRQGDINTIISHLICAQYGDLRPAWDELVISSLSLPEDGLTATDLDALEKMLSRQQLDITSLQAQIGAAAQAHLTEVDILRAVTQELSTTLTATANDLALSSARHSADATRTLQLDLEIQLLRDQMAETQSRQIAEQTRLGAMARDSARPPAELAPVHGLSNVLPSDCEAPNPPSDLPSSTEVTLLRQQLVDVTAMLQAIPPSDDGHSPVLATAHAKIESAFAALLSTLVSETDLRLQAQLEIAALPNSSVANSSSRLTPSPPESAVDQTDSDVMTPLSCFKAYDIRGRLGVDLDETIATRIGRAFAQALSATTVVIGHDCRESSARLSEAVIGALLSEGVKVLDLGLSGTEEMYHATTHFNADGGIMITASHNPIDYNGMKIVRKGSAPLDSANGLAAIKSLAEANSFGPTKPGGNRRDVASEARAAYVETVLSFVDVTTLQPLNILVNAGNGTAGPTFDAIAAGLDRLGAPLNFIRQYHDPDGTFPHGIPNPLLIENRPATAEAVLATGADLGVAWDGDFDRCFFFDANGAFIDGEYIVGLLADVFLTKEPGASIVHDPRVIWNTRDIVALSGGVAVQSRTGHAFVKQAMRDCGAVYGGEMSAHHYFRDFVYCDSGMIPWLLIAELICRSGHSLCELVADRKAAFPSSGEMNYDLSNPTMAIALVRAAYEPQATAKDETDGLSLEIEDWRFNLRSSNTEPVVRLNVESRGNAALLPQRVAAIEALLLKGCKRFPDQTLAV